MEHNLSIGPGYPVYIIGEIGLNHNGDIALAKQLMDVAATAGANAVKFQKRNPEVSTPKNMRDRLRQTPWGEMTYLEYRYRVEFGVDEYTEIDAYAKQLGLDWFASAWDVDSVNFLETVIPGGIVAHKVASATLCRDDVLAAIAATGKPILMSTGMSTWDEIDHAVEILGKENLIIMHSTSTYPMPPEEANLRCIPMIAERYEVPVGYSGHETGLQVSLAAVTLGAVTVERHITLDRSMWGSDQSASLEPDGFRRLVRDIRILEAALGDGVKRVMPGEIDKIKSLRGTST